MRLKNAVKLALLLAALAALPVQARIARSEAARLAFVQLQACPGTGLHQLPCPGYQIDHKIPLKCHGPDTPANLQWLTTEAHKGKTRREARHCRR